jgi:DNA repair protein RadD
MTRPRERDRALQVLEDALSISDEDTDNWVNSIRFSSSNKKIKDLLRKRINAVAPKLGWGSPAWPIIPSSVSLKFLVDALDNSLLECPEVREILVSSLVKTRPDDSLKQLKDIVGGCQNHELPNKVATYDFQMSTILASQMCILTGLPLSYSRRGSSDDRGPHGLIQPIRIPPPLADFQILVKEKLTSYILDDGGRALIVMPTGSGKTRTAIDSIMTWLEDNCPKPHSILWIADRDELCDQAILTFERLAPNIISEDLEFWRYWRGNRAEIRDTKKGIIVPGITVTTVQQLRIRLENREPVAVALVDNADIIIVDEAHRNLDWIEALGRNIKSNNQTTRLVGLTATPFRASLRETGRLSLLFNQRVCVPIEGTELEPERMVKELTNEGILASKLIIDPSDLYGNIEKGKREIEIINQLIKQGSKSIIVFTNDVEEARTLSAILRLNGDNLIRAEHIEASTPFSTRRRIISAFREGEIEVLFNYGILTTGFDSPGIDTVVIFRKSLDQQSSLFAQMIGRGLRGPRFGGTEECKIIHYRGD